MDTVAIFLSYDEHLITALNDLGYDSRGIHLATVTAPLSVIKKSLVYTALDVEPLEAKVSSFSVEASGKVATVNMTFDLAPFLDLHETLLGHLKRQFASAVYNNVALGVTVPLLQLDRQDIVIETSLAHFLFYPVTFDSICAYGDNVFYRYSL